MILVLLFFFFSSRRRHTRLQGDWSSDVCSSDLIGQGQLETALRVAAEYRDIFGPDHYFLEVQENGVPEQQIVNQGLREIHKRLGIPLVATNDCHYLRKADAKAHDILLCLQTGKTVTDPNRLRFQTDQLYVKSTEEMLAAFREWPEAVWNTA